jgi:hypothetical protein
MQRGAWVPKTEGVYLSARDGHVTVNTRWTVLQVQQMQSVLAAISAEELGHDSWRMTHVLRNLLNLMEIYVEGRAILAYRWEVGSVVSALRG